MANREELVIIRKARSGDAACQLALGKLYLAGGAGLPQSLPTALHWLSRAAGQGQAEAWLAIGHAIPHAVAAPCRGSVLAAYVKASQAGDAQAAVTLAQLVLQDPPLTEPALREQALRAVEAVAATGDAQAALLADRLVPAPPEAPLAVAAQPPRERCSAPVAGGPAHPLHERAAAGDRDAQLALGLQLARMDRLGGRVAPGAGTVSFKHAVRWLTLAGEQGLAEAWFALARLYLKAEFSLRDAATAQACLERAADLGHRAAQLECGMQAWRQRRDGADNDVRAAYWLQKAAAQECRQAGVLLDKVAPPAREASWATPLLASLTREQAASQPLLAARLELAHLFHLTRAEALLLDVKTADRGHCLVVDIRAAYGRSRRRLVLVRTARQRQALDRAARVFEPFDSGPAGAEGNYRRRLYRFKTWLQPVAKAAELLAA